jgi:hypothetical protein
MSATEKRVHRIHQHEISTLSANPTCLAQRQNALNPAVAFLTDKPKASFAPKHRESQHLFGIVIRTPDALLLQEQPQFFQLSPQMAGEFSGVILPIHILGNQPYESRIKKPLRIAYRLLRGGLAGKCQGILSALLGLAALLIDHVSLASSVGSTDDCLGFVVTAKAV